MLDVEVEDDVLDVVDGELLGVLVEMLMDRHIVEEVEEVDVEEL